MLFDYTRTEVLNIIVANLKGQGFSDAQAWRWLFTANEAFEYKQPIAMIYHDPNNDGKEILSRLVALGQGNIGS